MSKKVYRCYVEKKPGFDTAAKALGTELGDILGIPDIQIRILNRYDIQNIPAEQWQAVVNAVLSEPMCDIAYEEDPPPFQDSVRLLFIEPLPGQFDARADSCEQCVQMLLGGERPIVRTSRVYAIQGVCEADLDRIRSYLLNPIESRETSANKPDRLFRDDEERPDDIPVLDGFTASPDSAMEELRQEYKLAMSLPDLLMVRSYFTDQRRDPTLSEIRVIDTYWSDHCRHTTFNTVIESADIRDERVQKAYDLFLSVNGNKPVTLMRMATAAMRHLRAQGKLPMLDESEENNACTIRIKADFAHGYEDWLLFFKNETHNHPTEIEPFGGASTCIGGAIRDPLSGRAYVYQAMRITGAGDPRKPIEKTLSGKLPQRRLTVTAAEGYSSYGNQIGLATGYVKELYHEGYIAKRLETGAVVGAAPRSFVRRERPAPDDIVVLLGGRTGRDGIGGATGSSKVHSADTVSGSASEVQKGNAPEERKLQRLFRNPDVTKLIKRCNDFGAGGVSVAIGELADGVEINLDVIPVKYKGLNGTELAISESQERMAVVIDPSDLQAFLNHAEAENIEATVVAIITERKNLTMMWRGKVIVDIGRNFLDTNGARREAAVYVPPMSCGRTQARPETESTESKEEALPLKRQFIRLASDLNFCLQKGLTERFDGSIGAASLFMPHGGRHALTETQVMAALLPGCGTTTASAMAYGFDPYYTEADPFGGSAFAVVTSVAKLVAAGISPDTIHLSLQEYFPSVNDNAGRWGLPFSALLGAFSAQMGLQMAAIGGKDSMSGSFGDLDVPPTLISFAVGVGDATQFVSPEYKGAGHPVYLMKTPMHKDGLPDYERLLALWARYEELRHGGHILSAWVCEAGGVYGGIMKMALGNGIGFSGETLDDGFDRGWGSILFESNAELGSTEAESGEKIQSFTLLGYTQAEPSLIFGEAVLPLDELHAAIEAPLESVFPVKKEQSGEAPIITESRQSAPYRGDSFARPKAIITVFPGTNCEYDTSAAIERAGGISEIVLVRNQTPAMLNASITEMEKSIRSAQIIVFPGGFSGGDEPDGSGKFIVSLFRNARLEDAVMDLLQNRDGLILGICNGFQALIKLGLLPYGNISPMAANHPTLTFNNIGRHQSLYVGTRVASTLSPWLAGCKPGTVYFQPVSHGEGRFVASEEVLNTLKENGQIAFQYADENGLPSMDISHNPNGSDWAIEGICSPDGRILGKMAHSERCGEHVAKNIPGNKFLPIFEGGVGYFK